MFKNRNNIIKLYSHNGVVYLFLDRVFSIVPDEENFIVTFTSTGGVKQKIQLENSRQYENVVNYVEGLMG